MNVAHKTADRGREDNPSLAEHDPAATADATPAPATATEPDPGSSPSPAHEEACNAQERVEGLTGN